MGNSQKIFVAGHRGLVGSALLRKLREAGTQNIITRSRDELDLTDRRRVGLFFEHYQPEIVILAAARVGGILANSHYPADFIRDNLSIQLNVIEEAYRTGTRKLLFLGSSCIYPKNSDQPIKEEYLLTGALEPTNEAYAVAKIAGITMCRAYRKQFGFDALCVMPSNLYGPHDNFDLATSHVLPALLRKIHDAKYTGASYVEIWGSGSPKREFLHVDDLAEACLFIMDQPSDCMYEASHEGVVNVGLGHDISIRDLADLICAVVGFEGDLRFDETKPDGTARKLLDVTRMTGMGWTAKTSLRAGIESTYRWCLEEPCRTDLR